MLFRSTAESFKQRQAEENLTDSIDIGLRTVEVRKIVGSVNRWQDFDARFRIKNPSTRYRYQDIKRAMERGKILPAVELYKVGDKYYVVDGNHRVAAAKEVGQAYIDAHVTEFLPPADSPDHLLWREKSAFQRKTNLNHIHLTQLGSYERLLEQIEEFREEESRTLGKELPLAKAAQNWDAEIYTPVVKQIRAERLLDDFPGRTEADLFLYATYHRMAKSRLTNEEVSYREALADFRQTPQKTLGEKIIDTITSILHIPDPNPDCPLGLILDEDGLVKITRDCKGCARCKAEPEPLPLIIDDEANLKRLP